MYQALSPPPPPRLGTRLAKHVMLFPGKHLSIGATSNALSAKSG